MNDIAAIIRGKPAIFLAVNILYVVITGIIRWRTGPTLNALWYLAGGITGVYFLDVAEAVFAVRPSPFRSIVFFTLFAAVAFFIVTSSGSFLAIGLVLSLFLTMLLWQYGEWQARGSLHPWYSMVKGPVPVTVQKNMLIGFAAFFLMLTFLFVRS